MYIFPVLFTSLGVQGACLEAKLNSTDFLAEPISAGDELKKVDFFFSTLILCLLAVVARQTIKTGTLGRSSTLFIGNL